jgi:hypothetical protein
MEDGAPRVVYNADDGSVIIEAAGPVITVENIVGEVVFERLTTEGEMAVPLWLGRHEARVLANMIGYIVKQIDGGQLRIREDSEQVLREILPRAESLAAAAESDNG